MIEALTGQSCQQVIAQKIFTPLGMHNSGYDDAQTVIPRRASG
ncbi:MAG: serine hydrolase [Acidobacteria bacterium]|nr:serine hydrolase [Acidobacteriota bacterium]MCB9397229.1 serine hydrolase [Acidobacteriota bacterium]